MATALYRLGRTAYRRWPVFILAWVLAILAVGGFASAKSKPMVDSFTIPGIPSLAAADLQKELFPSAVSADKQVSGQVVLKAPEGHTLTEQPYRSQVDSLVAALQKAPQLKAGQKLANPAVAGPAIEQQVVGAATKQGTPAAVAKENAKYLSPLSAGKNIGTISWDFDVDNAMDVKPASQDYVNDAVAEAEKGGLTVAVGGNGMQAFEIGKSSEIIGIGFALVILVLTFGSLVAAGLPIIGAIVGVALGGLFVTAATAFLDINSNTPTLSSMIGLAVGIDYALFILSRYRSEVNRTGDREHAIGIALGTAGSAVVFAGTTVVIALAALYFSGISILGSMGFAAAGTVILAVLVALTLLPALLGMLKGKAFAGRVRKQVEVDEEDHSVVNGSVRLGNGIRKAPVIVSLVATLGLVLLATPVTHLHLGLPSDATAAVGTEARTSADLLAEGWGPGKNAPMIAVVDAREVPAQQRQQAVGRVLMWAQADKDVQNAQIAQATKDMSGAVVLITPKTGPADTATEDLLDRMRNGQDDIEKVSGTTLGVTGLTAIQADISEKLAGALPLYLAIVVGLAFIILVLVFRSLVVPAMATAGFLLSVLATLGITIKLVQDGLFGLFDPQPIMSLMPTLLIGIVFGLAMDYQVFLTTRMREAYVHGMDPRDAIIDGFRHSGRVVTAAALIMISVFAAFAFQDNALIKTIGMALAVAIFLDAFIVRMILIPAGMFLLGDKAWWMPRWLDKILPEVDVEGAGLDRDGHLDPTTEPASVADGRPGGATAPALVATATAAHDGAPVAQVTTPQPSRGSHRYEPATPSTDGVRPDGYEPQHLAEPRPEPALVGAAPADAGWHTLVGRVSHASAASTRVVVLASDGRPIARTTTAPDGTYEIDVPASQDPHRVVVEIDLAD